MNILICTDLEGVSGVVDFENQAYGTGKYYEQARKLLTAEINAGVEGMVAEGISDILVIDGHGPGAVCFEDLHPSAKLFHGRPWAWKTFREKILPQYAATVMIGQHAMAGVEQGNLNHTQNSREIEYCKLNGRLVGEIAQWALCAGSYGVPLIFLSGDEAACREAQDLIPGMTTAAVKTGLSRTSAISVSPAEAHRRIREGIRLAIQRQREKPIAPVVWQCPFVLEKRFFHTGSVDAYASNGMARRVDALTVQLQSDRIDEVIYQ